ncbi:MAG: helix-turn-helix domain-containing protein [Candidatus Promineifilaceae bacterium]
MNKDYISTAEAAKELGVHQTTVQRWVKSGWLEGGKLGPGRTSRYRVRTSSVVRLQRQLTDK